MVSPSSTSSSELPREICSPAAAGLPWGGALALALGLLVQAALLGDGALWDWLAEHQQRLTLLEQGLVIDRQEVARAAASESLNPRVVMVGTSRLEAGFREELIDDELRPPIDFYQHTHARVFAHEISSQLSEILAIEPDLVVFNVSEFELLQPFRLVPPAWGGDLGALLELIGRTNLSFAFEHREPLLRMACAGLSDLYRYRTVLAKTLLPRINDALAGPSADPPAAQAWDAAIVDGTPKPLASERFQSIVARLLLEFPDRADTIKAQANQIRSLRPGTHSELKQGIMTRNIERCLEAGVAVVLFEGALHPGVAELYDEPSARGAYLSWARELARLDNVTFLPRETLGEILAEEYRDITHVNKLGALRTTLVLMDWCARELTPTWHQSHRGGASRRQPPR